ncbi:MAG: hypothetical protein R2716_00910 [Microthrixaceae bacterium]
MSVADGIAQLRDAGSLPAVRSEIANRKAMDWPLERAEIVDPEGLGDTRNTWRHKTPTATQETQSSERRDPWPDRAPQLHGSQRHRDDQPG